MNFYTIVDNIIASTQRPIIGKTVSGTMAADANVLSHMCTMVKRLTATNGRYYWYFFMCDQNDLDVAKFLFRRNGLAPQFHNSRYYTYGTHRNPTLRIEYKYLESNPQFAEFINAIAPKFGAKADYQDLMAFIRNQMKQAQK